MFIDTIEQLNHFTDITRDEEREIFDIGSRYPWRITDYYASLMDDHDRTCPIRLQAVPSVKELSRHIDDDDPLSEEDNSPCPGVIRVYPDRIAVIVTSRCPMYCRFCLRKRLERTEEDDLKGARLEKVLAYIRSDSSIRDVLLTGGDPLILGTGELDNIIGKLRMIPHVEVIRIGTRAPCTWPERIDAELADMLASHHPVWLNTQFNHPKEVTAVAARAVDLLLSRGIPVGNQSVLLRGINDSVEVMKELLQRLIGIRVRPYYLYQAQVLAGTGHFVTPIEKGIDIIRQIRGWTTGFAVPQYVLDTPYGKVPINPDYFMGRDGDEVVMQSYDGRIWREKNPVNGSYACISKEQQKQ